MRLLLDEHYSPEIATRLVSAGHDVTALQADPGSRGMDDEQLLRTAAEQGRALLTNNVSDFVPIARDFAARGEHHAGLVFTSDESLPRARNTIGRYVRALDRFLTDRPSDDAMTDRIEWI